MTALRSSGTILLACVLTTGCLTHRAPHKVKDSIEEQLGEHLVRESGVKLGWASTRLVASFAGADDDDDSLALGDLTGIAFAIYSREKGGKAGLRLDPVKMGLGDWQPVVRVRDADEQVLVLAKSGRNGIHKMMFVTVDPGEVVIGSLRGKLDHLLGSVMRAAKEDGPAGARLALTVKQEKSPHGSGAEDPPRGAEPAR